MQSSNCDYEIKLSLSNNPNICKKIKSALKAHRLEKSVTYCADPNLKSLTIYNSGEELSKETKDEVLKLLRYRYSDLTELIIVDLDSILISDKVDPNIPILC